VRQEGLGKLRKKSMTSSEIELVTFRLVAQCHYYYTQRRLIWNEEPLGHFIVLRDDSPNVPLHTFQKAEVFTGFQSANMSHTKSLYYAGEVDDHTGCVVRYWKG
jgi:hypothetical protein